MSPPLERLRLSALDKDGRPSMNQTEFDAEYGTSLPQESPSDRFHRRLHQSFQPFSSASSLGASLLSFIPITSWIRTYDWKKDLLSDIVGGLTTGVMHVPQGIAYSVLAGVDPVYGLYASCFPAFFYMLFGTSRHTSLGSFAVVALMAGITAEGVIEKTNTSPIHAATAVALSIGIWQILCGLLRLQFILSYFSTPLVSGFTTGAAVHVLIAQIDDILGVEVPKSHGPGYIFVRVFDLGKSLPNTNLATLLISLVSILFLFSGKQFIAPLLAKKCGLPIPFELILVVTTAFLSFFFTWNKSFDVLIVGNIPAGIPTPQLPPIQLLTSAFLPSVSISVVTIAVHISMAKMLANKFDYRIDTNQELYAIGFSSCLGSFFPIYAVSTALGRTMVSVRSGTRTQLSTLFSCFMLLSIIIWLGPFLATLPKCVLASIIIVALQSMFEKITEPLALWPISKFDALTWIIALLATVCIDVMEGLALALVFAIVTVVMRTQWPHWKYYVPEEEKEDEADVALIRFEGPLQFTNGERFKKAVFQVIQEWESPPRRPTCLFFSARFFIIDCSAIVYLDSVGVEVLKETCQSIENMKIIVYLSGANEEFRHVLERSDFSKIIPMDRFFPTVRDAISTANRNMTACKLLCLARKDGSHTPSPCFNSPGPIIRISDQFKEK